MQLLTYFKIFCLQHQIELIEKAKRAFVELMLEHAEVFAQVRSDSSPMATITQQQVREIFEVRKIYSKFHTF